MFLSAFRFPVWFSVCLCPAAVFLCRLLLSGLDLSPEEAVLPPVLGQAFLLPDGQCDAGDEALIACLKEHLGDRYRALTRRGGGAECCAITGCGTTRGNDEGRVPS